MAYSLARLAFLGTGLVTAACASAGSADPLVLYPSSPEAHEALLRGRLSLEGACLYITGEGGERWLAAFPSPGTAWEPGERAVRVGARMIRVGDAGAFGGGEVTNASGIRWVRAPAGSCDAAKLWMVSALRAP